MEKALLIFAGIILLFTNCNKSNKILHEKNFKIAYKEGYKIEYFKKLLLISFNQYVEIKKIIEIDQSKGMADLPLTNFELSLIDSFAIIGNAKMIQDSIRNTSRAEGAQGKYIFSNALKEYNSKWLDSLANEGYKRYKKSN